MSGWGKAKLEEKEDVMMGDAVLTARVILGDASDTLEANGYVDDAGRPLTRVTRTEENERRAKKEQQHKLGAQNEFNT